MKGFKGFKKGLISAGGIQYTENTVFEEEKAEVCKSGIHFCKNPFHVWKYYPPCNSYGELNEFTEVEAMSEVKGGNGKDDYEFCTTKLKIGHKIPLDEYVKFGVDYYINNLNEINKESNMEESSVSFNMGEFTSSSNSGYMSVAINTGTNSISANTGDWSTSSNMGNNSISANTGYMSIAINIGNYSTSSDTGYMSTSIDTGNNSISTNTGYMSTSSNTGNNSISANTGDYSSSSNTGNNSISANTGDYSKSIVKGKNSIAIVTGYDSQASGTKGCWIVLCERNNDDQIICIKSAKVDGETIKENTFYKLKNGEFVEV